jgi:hypothetical protein
MSTREGNSFNQEVARDTERPRAYEELRASEVR